MKVAVLANLKKNAPKLPGQPDDQWDDLDSESTVEALCQALRQSGHEAWFVEGDVSLYDRLRDKRPDICFNICEGHFGDAREAQVPAMLEMLRLPYTGSKVLTLALALDKPMTKRVLYWHELRTPAFQTFEHADKPLDDDMEFPLFVKPSREGTGMGVSAHSIVRDEAELRERLQYMIGRYQQTALVERYIEGREVTVGMIGNIVGPAARRLPRDPSKVGAGLTMLPPLEFDLEPYRETDAVYSGRLKVEVPDEIPYVCPAHLPKDVVDELNFLAAAIFRVTGCLDVARVDFRLDIHDNLKPYLLEINPLPGLSPVISDLVIGAEAIGIHHTQLVNRILDVALIRYGMKTA
ncbi:MAG: hypothetical protein HY260_03180 [Chloroflexi bacterium]|nr:hypothetical protein [Chloroflexota bacterium]